MFSSRCFLGILIGSYLAIAPFSRNCSCNMLNKLEDAKSPILIRLFLQMLKSESRMSFGKCFGHSASQGNDTRRTKPRAVP